MIRFRVENSWLDSNNHSPEDIRMLRWDGLWWTMLETQQNGRDGNYTYYEAQTDILTTFAIIGIDAGSQLHV